MIVALAMAAVFLSATLLSATAVSDDDRTGRPASFSGISNGPASFHGVPSKTIPPSSPLRTPLRTPTPQPTPPPTPAPTPSPTQPPTPPPTPVPTPVTEICADPLSVNVVNPELIAEVQSGAELLAQYLHCQKFSLDGTGVPVKFAEITPMFNAKVLGYAQNAPGAYEIWLNPDCWGVVGSWAEVIAHELGHYLGWQHGEDRPYMWLAPPSGSYATGGDAKLVCY